MNTTSQTLIRGGAVALLFVSSIAMAEVSESLRGIIESVDGQTLLVKARNGRTTKVKLVNGRPCLHIETSVIRGHQIRELRRYCYQTASKRH